MNKAELVAQQLLGGNLNKVQWGSAMYNVLVEGLAGGGVVDDTAKLQALVDKAIAEGRKAIFFPHGTNGQYYVTALTNANQVVFFGDNASFVGGYTGIIHQIGDWISATDVGSLYVEKNSFVYDVTDFGVVSGGITNDSSDIQSALNAAKTSGGDVFFPDGVYGIGTTLKVPSNVKLIFAKNAKLLRISNIDAMILNDSDGTTGVYGANSNIHILGGIFDANKDNFPTDCTSIGFAHCTNITVENAKFINTSKWHALELNAVQNAIVRNCAFKDYSATGSEMLQIDISQSVAFPWFGPHDNTPCLNVTVRDCLFENGIDGIGTHNFQAGVLHKNIKIINNTFRNFTGNCIRGYNYSDMLIDGNYFENGLRGVNLATADGGIAQNIRIINNEFIDMRYAEADSRGIVVGKNHQYGEINGNIIRNIGKHGISVDLTTDWLLANNIVEYCGSSNIYIYGSSECVITGNRIFNCNMKAGGGYDLFVGSVSATISNNVLVSGNRIGKPAIQHSDKATIINNILDAAVVVSTGNTNQQISANRVAGVWTP